MTEPPPAGPPPYGGGGPYGPPYPGPPPYGQAYAPAPPQGPPRGHELPSYPHAQREPYHRILRTWTYHWWRVLVGLVLALALGAFAGPLLVLALVGAGLDLFGLGSAGRLFEELAEARGTPEVLLVVNLSLALLIPITWLITRYLHHLRPRWLGSVRPGLRWRWLGVCFGLALVATLVAAVAMSLVLGETAPGEPQGAATSTATTVAFLVVIALTSPLQSAGEEYFFRGYLLQGFGALVRAPWFTLVCTSLLFALAHGSQNLALFVDRFAFGLVAGGLVLFTGGLEAGIAMHIVNNVVVLGLAAATGAVPETLATSDAPWSMVAFDLGQFGLYAVLVVLSARRYHPETVTPGPPTAG